ncbi:MAG: site-specific DNA-methyltransferase [Candidatus Micrarchaeaceae archaeon]
MSAKNNTELQDYKEEFVEEEEEKPIALPEQEELFKMPKKFGTVPDVDKAPLDWDSKKGYTHLFPQLRLPFQKIEEIPFGNPDLEPKNRLFWGDNLHIMRLLPSESIDLIYIDPPFFSGRNYNVVFGDQNEVMTFKDIWDGGIHTYLVWLNARLVEMKRLLKSNGSIYVHLDWHALHYVKVELDKIFGYKNFRNEIIWFYPDSPGRSDRDFPSKHDTILRYVKNKYKWTFNDKDIRIPILKESKERYKTPRVLGGREYIGGKSAEIGKIPEDVWRIPVVKQNSEQALGYPTQKPEGLLERIIKASSNEGDIVADFFCGGGTTPAVAQRLGRRWIASDISRIAVEITKGRILKLLKSETGRQISLGKIPNIEVWSWGFYDVDKLKESSNDEFKEFVVRAFGGRPIIGEKTISGVKNGLPILVGSNDPKKPITKDEVLGFAKYVDANYELRKTGIILAWSFSEGAIKARDALANLGSDVEFVKIKTLRIGSVEFINEVIENNEEYKKVFRFVFPPQVILHVYKEDHKTYIFDFSDSVSLNNGKIINIQADFDFDGKFVPTKGYVFNLDELVLKYHFDSDGKKKIAFRVEDDQGGEKLIIKELSV